MTDRFHTDFSDLYEMLDAARMNMRSAGHSLLTDPSNATIDAYEGAIAEVAAVREQIGARHAADIARREAAGTR